MFLTCLLFVDGVLLFYDCSRRDALKFKGIIDGYCTAIGMMENIGKSSIYLSKIDDEEDNLLKCFFSN